MKNISTSNYLDIAKGLNFSKMPEALKESHAITLEAAEDNWLAYREVPEIKEMVDLYFEKLPAYMPEDKPKPRITSTKKRLVPTESGYQLQDVEEDEDTEPYYTSYQDALKYTLMAKDVGGLMMSAVKNALEQTAKRGIISKSQKTDLLKKMGWVDNNKPAPKAHKSLYEMYYSYVHEIKTQADATRVANLVKSAQDDADLDSIQANTLLKMIEAKIEKKPSKAKKEPKPKKVKQPKYKAPVAYHDHFTEAETVIKSFINMNGKVKTKKQIKALLDKVNKFVVERKIRKSDPNAEAVLLVRASLTKAEKVMNGDSDKIEIDLSDKTLAVLHKFTKQSKVYPTVALLKRFIPMMGTAPEMSKAKNLLKDITSALKAQTISKKDTYYSHLSEAIDELMNYVHNKGTKIRGNYPNLSGLGSLPEFAGLGCPGMDDADCGCTKKTTLAGVKKKDQPKPKEEKLKLPKTLQGLFTPIDQPGVDTAKNTLRLKGDLGRFLGKIERKEFAIALRGEKGAGKTRLLYQLKDAFAEMGFSVASFSLEIDKGSDLVKRMSEAYIKPKNRSKVQVASISPNGITTIREAAKHFDVVAIDSWSKLNVKQDEFDKLRKDFPNTFFLVIFQSTTAGTARGGSMAEYDAGIVIQVDVPGVAYCEKNRYADADGVGLKYLVFEQKLQNETL